MASTKSPALGDVDHEARARRYARWQRALFVAELVVGVAFLLALLASGVLRPFATLEGRPSGAVLPVEGWPTPLGAVAAFVVMTVGYGVVSLPLTYGGYALSRRYGLSVQSLGSWLADLAKGLLLGIAIGGILVAAVYWLLATQPDWWWLYAAAVFVAFSVVLAQLAPVLLLPLFYRLEPLADAELVGRLTALAERFGTRVRGVFTMRLSAKTTTANAALMGLGRTRRITIGDTLLQGYSADEIEAVFAHELGHHVHGDIPKAIVVEGGLHFASFWLVSRALPPLASALGLGGIADPAGLPLLALLYGAIGMVATPLLNAYSRGREAAADAFALRAIGGAEPFVAMMQKLGRQNLAEPEPSRLVELLFYDHPPLGKRVRAALQFEVEQSAG